MRRTSSIATSNWRMCYSRISVRSSCVISASLITRKRYHLWNNRKPRRMQATLARTIKSLRSIAQLPIAAALQLTWHQRCSDVASDRRSEAVGIARRIRKRNQ